MPGTPFPPTEADRPGPSAPDSPEAAALRAKIAALTPARPGSIGNQHPEDDTTMELARRAIAAGDPWEAVDRLETALRRVRSDLEDSQRSVRNALARCDRLEAELAEARHDRQVLASYTADSRIGRESRDLRRQARAVVAASDREEGAAPLPLRQAAPSSHPDGPFVWCVDETPIVHGAAKAVLPPHVSMLLGLLRGARPPAAPIVNDAGYVDLDATYRTGTPASDALVAENRARAVRAELARAYHVSPEQVDQLVADARAQALADEQADTEATQEDDRA